MAKGADIKRFLNFAAHHPGIAWEIAKKAHAEVAAERAALRNLPDPVLNAMNATSDGTMSFDNQGTHFYFRPTTVEQEFTSEEEETVRSLILSGTARRQSNASDVVRSALSELASPLRGVAILFRAGGDPVENLKDIREDPSRKSAAISELLGHHLEVALGQNPHHPTVQTHHDWHKLMRAIEIAYFPLALKHGATHMVKEHALKGLISHHKVTTSEVDLVGQAYSAGFFALLKENLILHPDSDSARALAHEINMFRHEEEKGRVFGIRRRNIIRELIERLTPSFPNNVKAQILNLNRRSSNYEGEASSIILTGVPDSSQDETLLKALIVAKTMEAPRR